MPVPRELERIVLWCLDRRPGERPQTADELSRALAEVPVDAMDGGTGAGMVGDQSAVPLSRGWPTETASETTEIVRPLDVRRSDAQNP